MVNNTDEPTENQLIQLATWQAKDTPQKTYGGQAREKIEAKIAAWENMGPLQRLPAGLITVLSDIYTEVVQGRYRDVSTSAMEKGTIAEEESITLAALMDRRYYVKNEEQFEDEYKKGTPDLLFKETSPGKWELVSDTKTSWEPIVHRNKVQKGLQQPDYWQVLSYMDLTGARKGYVKYCLVNTPDHIIEKEKRRLFYELGLNVIDEHSADYDVLWAAYQDGAQEIEMLGNVDDIPAVLRYHKIPVEYNKNDIDRLHQRIVDCRAWLKAEQKREIELIKSYLNQ